MLSWLEGTPVSEWVATSDLGYPILLAIHSMGMATVVGLLVLLDLRVLGFAKAVPIAAFRALMPLAWIGFALNLVSGTLLFMSTATHMVSNWPFLSKMASICLGGVVSWALWRNLIASGWAAPVGDGTGVAGGNSTARVLAIASIVVWLAAILFGRLIAYVLDAAMLAG
jgi:hypothetical protein